MYICDMYEQSLKYCQVKYHKNTEQNTAKIPNEIPQKTRIGNTIRRKCVSLPLKNILYELL